MATSLMLQELMMTRGDASAFKASVTMHGVYYGNYMYLLKEMYYHSLS